jgi:hypothetical protein
VCEVEGLEVHGHEAAAGVVALLKAKAVGIAQHSHGGIDRGLLVVGQTAPAAVVRRPAQEVLVGEGRKGEV